MTNEPQILDYLLRIITPTNFQLDPSSPLRGIGGRHYLARVNFFSISGLRLAAVPTPFLPKRRYSGVIPYMGPKYNRGLLKKLQHRRNEPRTSKRKLIGWTLALRKTTFSPTSQKPTRHPAG